MATAKDNDYGTLRLKKDTIEYLKDLKDAYELSYGKRMTNDEFIRKMADSIEDGDPSVWEIYCKQEELRDLAEETRKKKMENLK